MSKEQKYIFDICTAALIEIRNSEFISEINKTNDP